MKTAACYIRVSTEDQLEFSPDAQLRAMRKYCDENDLLLPDEFIYIDATVIIGLKQNPTHGRRFSPIFFA